MYLHPMEIRYSRAIAYIYLRKLCSLKQFQQDDEVEVPAGEEDRVTSVPSVEDIKQEVVPDGKL